MLRWPNEQSTEAQRCVNVSWSCDFFYYQRVWKKHIKTIKLGCFPNISKFDFIILKGEGAFFSRMLSITIHWNSPCCLTPGAPNWLAHARDRGKACLVASRWSRFASSKQGFPVWQYYQSISYVRQYHLCFSCKVMWDSQVTLKKGSRVQYSLFCC